MTERYAKAAFRAEISCPVVSILLQGKTDSSGRHVLKRSMFADLLQSMNEVKVHVANPRRLSGLNWKNTGRMKPPKGRELTNSNLAEALKNKSEILQWRNKCLFTEEEWDSFGIGELRSGDFMKAGNCYYKPLGLDLPSRVKVVYMKISNTSRGIRPCPSEVPCDAFRARIGRDTTISDLVKTLRNQRDHNGICFDFGGTSSPETHSHANTY
jgi:hypothetical protein